MNAVDVQSIDIPIDSQWIFDHRVPFHSLVLKPQSAAFDTVLEILGFTDTEGQAVIVIFTNMGINALLPIRLAEDGPGMWVLAGNTSTNEIESIIRITDGTNILIPEVHLAELTGVFGDLLIDAGFPMLPAAETWSECLLFARFPYSEMLTLPQNMYDRLLPQLTKELPAGTLVAIIQ